MASYAIYTSYNKQGNQKVLQDNFQLKCHYNNEILAKYPLFYVFVHNRSFVDVLSNFNLLQTLELVVFASLFPRI